jgi:two-component system chemotaxis sensor kinase CheA
MISSGMFLAVTGVAGFGVLWRGFLRLESEEIEREALRVRSKFDAEIKSTQTKLNDWAAWDDMYDYALTKSRKFEQSNLLPYSSLANLGHDLMVVTNRNHKIINALRNDNLNGTATKLDPVFTEKISKDAAFRDYFMNPAKPTAAGYVTDGSRVWIITSRQITKTDGSGDPAGVLFLGRLVTPDVIKGWSGELHMEFWRDDQPAEHHNTDTSVSLAIDSDDSISATTGFTDYLGNHAFTVKARFNRGLMAQGRFTIWSMAGIIVAGTSLLTALLLWLLKGSILNRLTSLSAQTATIGRSTRRGEHVAVTGSDEIGELAASINQMLDVIEERTTQIKEIVQHVSFGMFITDTNGKILRGHTKSCGDLLGLGISGLPLNRALHISKDQEQLIELIFDQLREDIVPAEISLNQLPKRVRQNGKVIAIQGSPIREQSGRLVRILFSLVDVTSEVDTERENTENKTLISVLRAKTGFSNLIRHTRLELAEIIKTLDEPGQIQARMKLHTLNGNLRTFGLKVLSQIISDAESLAEIRLADIKKIETSTRAWVAKFETVTGVRWDQNAAKATHEIAESNLQLFEREIASSSTVSEETKAYVAAFGKFTRAKKIGEIFSPLTTLTLDVAKSLKKRAVLVVEGSELRVNQDAIQPLVDAIPHLIRNALDHGIETMAERLEAKKQDVATLYISIEKLGHQKLRISFSDDGRGIYPDKIAAAAIRKGLISAAAADKLSDVEKSHLILLPGFTSATEITDISGRGIGLSAVKELIETKLSGKFSLESQPGSGTKITMDIPVETIEMPTLPPVKSPAKAAS